MAIICLDFFTGVYNLHDHSLAWALPYGETFGIEYDNGNTWGDLYPVHWSVDGRYLYLTPFPCCIDGGCPAYMDGLALLRLDLLTGEITQTLQPGQRNQFYNISFSPNDAYLAYIRTWIDHPILNIQNMITGEDQHIPLGDQYIGAGNVVWSPDFTRIVFSARSGELCDNIVNYVVMLDLDDYDQTVLLDGLLSAYYPTAWTDDDLIILEVDYREYATLNLATGELAPYITPTPTPGQ